MRNFAIIIYLHGRIAFIKKKYRFQQNSSWLYGYPVDKVTDIIILICELIQFYILKNKLRFMKRCRYIKNSIKVLKTNFNNFL